MANNTNTNIDTTRLEQLFVARKQQTNHYRRQRNRYCFAIDVAIGNEIEALQETYQLSNREVFDIFPTTCYNTFIDYRDKAGLDPDSVQPEPPKTLDELCK